MTMQRRQPIIVLVAAVAAVLAGGVAVGQALDHTTAPAAIASALPWSRPVQLSGKGAIGSPGGTHPLAFGKTVYAAWVQNGVLHFEVQGDLLALWTPPSAAVQ